MNWNNLNSIDQIDEIINLSQTTPVLVFKHSTRCSISSMALSRLERSWDIDSNSLAPYLLDLITFRNISNAITEQFKVEHQSPQVVVISKGKAIFNASHMAISLHEIKSNID